MMPMLKICTPPPLMDVMNTGIGSDLAGEIVRSHARCLIDSYDAVADWETLEDVEDFD